MINRLIALIYIYIYSIYIYIYIYAYIHTLYIFKLFLVSYSWLIFAANICICL